MSLDVLPQNNRFLCSIIQVRDLLPKSDFFSIFVLRVVFPDKLPQPFLPSSAQSQAPAGLSIALISSNTPTPTWTPSDLSPNSAYWNLLEPPLNKLSSSICLTNLFMPSSLHVHAQLVNILFVTCSWFAHDLFITCLWLVYNLFTTCSWLVHDLSIHLSMTCLWLIYNFFSTCAWLLLTCHDFFLTCSWHVYNLFTTCSWFVHDLFINLSKICS